MLSNFLIRDIKIQAKRSYEQAMNSSDLMREQKPTSIMFVPERQLITDCNYRRNDSTEFMLRVTGYGVKRIYWSYPFNCDEKMYCIELKKDWQHHVAVLVLRAE